MSRGMKTIGLILFAGLLAAVIPEAAASPLGFPKAKPCFSLSIPDSWSPQFTPEGALEAISPDQDGEVLLREFKGLANLEDAADEVETLVSIMIDKPDFKEGPGETQVGGMRGLVFRGAGTDKLTGQTVFLTVLVFQGTAEGGFVAFYAEWDADATGRTIQGIEKIAASIRKKG